MGLRGKRSEEKQNKGQGSSISRDADLSQLDEGVEANGDVAPEIEDDSSSAGEGDEEVSRLNAEVAKLKIEVATFKDKYLRALADHENAVRHARKDRSDLIKYQGEPIIVDLLEVIDSFDRAFEYSDGDSAQFREGIRLIHKQLVDALGKWEIRPEPALGTEFDPNRHRAIARAKADGKKAGTVVAELKKPYRYRDKLLRFGEVVVAGSEEEQAEPNQDGPNLEESSLATGEDKV